MITIDYKSRKPIYEQIIENVKQLIIAGVLQRDEQLPPVRQLALELTINPNTIQKAYAELERQGIIYSLKGKGSYVGSSLHELSQVQKDQLFQELDQLCIGLMRLQISADEVCQQVQKSYQKDKGVGQ